MIDRARPALRVMLVLATLALLTATHWPGMKIDGPVPRTDMWIHALTYGVWTALFAFAGLAGEPGTARGAILAALAGVALGALDELTQPLFTRTADATDLLADALGAALGAGAAWAAARALAARADAAPD